MPPSNSIIRSRLLPLANGEVTMMPIETNLVWYYSTITTRRYVFGILS